MNHQMYTVFRIFKSGFTNLSRNLWLTIAATAVMLVALTIISLAVVLNITANNAIDVLAQNLKASIYLNDDVTTQQRGDLENEIRKIDVVSGVEFISSDLAQKNLAEDFKNDEGILQAYELVGGSVLPASLQISVSDLSRMQEIADVANQDKYKDIVSEVSLGQTDAKKTIDRAAATQKFITLGSIISASVLSAVSIMIIFNTIRMAIYTRRDEISIMKLIGATPNYIRGPFLVEASLYGVFAGIVASTVVYALVFSLGAKVKDQAEFTQTYSYLTDFSTIVLMFFSAIMIGILIGAVSSMLAMEKHLKLKHW